MTVNQTFSNFDLYFLPRKRKQKYLNPCPSKVDRCRFGRGMTCMDFRRFVYEFLLWRRRSDRFQLGCTCVALEHLSSEQFEIFLLILYFALFFGTIGFLGIRVWSGIVTTKVLFPRLLGQKRRPIIYLFIANSSINDDTLQAVFSKIWVLRAVGRAHRVLYNYLGRNIGSGN